MPYGFFPKKEVMNNTPWREVCSLRDKQVHYTSSVVDAGYPKWYPEAWQDWEQQPLPEGFSVDSHEEAKAKGMALNFKKLRGEWEYHNDNST